MVDSPFAEELLPTAPTELDLLVDFAIADRLSAFSNIDKPPW